VGALKAVACGASAVQLVSALLRAGPDYIRTVVKEMTEWLAEHEYHSLSQLEGSMNLSGCPDPEAFPARQLHADAPDLAQPRRSSLY
jgi:dihydroorotate dehydrogenase (fumarate)